MGSYSILNFLEEKNIFEIREIAINSSLNHFISHNSIIFIKSYSPTAHIEVACDILRRLTRFDLFLKD